MIRDGMDAFVQGNVPPVQVSAQRVDAVMGAVLDRLDARAAATPPLPVLPSAFFVVSRFAMPVVLGIVLGILVTDFSPPPQAGLGVATLIASVYDHPGNY